MFMARESAAKSGEGCCQAGARIYFWFRLLTLRQDAQPLRTLVAMLMLA
jgi:hypothetical protein